MHQKTRVIAVNANHTGKLFFTKVDTVAGLFSGNFSITDKEVNVNTTGDSTTITVNNVCFTNSKITRKILGTYFHNQTKLQCRKKQSKPS